MPATVVARSPETLREENISWLSQSSLSTAIRDGTPRGGPPQSLVEDFGAVPSSLMVLMGTSWWLGAGSGLQGNTGVAEERIGRSAP